MKQPSTLMDEILSPRSFRKMGTWMKDAVTTIASEIGHAILEDLVDFDENYGIESSGPSSNPTEPSCRGMPEYASEVIKLLSSDSTYLSDPSAHDMEDFEAYEIDPRQAALVLHQFPSLKMRIEHYKVSSMVHEEERILKRLLFKLSRLDTYIESDIILVDSVDVILVEDGDEFVTLQ